MAKIEREVKSFGNGAHIVVPKELIGEKVEIEVHLNE